MSNKRSSITTAGPARAPNRAMLRAVGFGDGDFDKPIVGIANAHSTITPCNAGLNVLADSAEQAMRDAGGMPQTFGTITISDGISMGTPGMKYSLISREVIADSIDAVVNGQQMDGVLVIGGCDKNMPGGMMAIARRQCAVNLCLWRHHQARPPPRRRPDDCQRLRGGGQTCRRQAAR